MRKRVLSSLLAAVLAGTILAGCGSGSDKGSKETASSGAQTEVPAEMEASSGEGVSGVTYSLGSVAAETSVQIEAAKMFADRVNELTDGAITINVFPASQLGSDESMCEDLSRGVLEFSFLNQGSCAGFDQMLDCHYLPYIARDYEEADALFYGDGIIPTTLTKTLNSHGIEVIGWYENEFRGLSSNTPVTCADDVKNLKLRVPGSAAIKDYFTELGVQCVTLTMGELYTALQQNTCDGQDNGVLITHDNMIDEVNAYYTYTRHVYAVSAMAVSSQIWNQFSAKQQEAVLTAAKEAQEWEIEATRNQIAGYLEEMAANGVTIHELTDDEMQTFVDVADTTWENMRSVYGDEYIDGLKVEVAAIRGE